MWQDALKEVADTMKMFGETINAGLAETDIQKFVTSIEQELGSALPIKYLEILKVVNGLEFNGSILYGSDEQFIGSVPN